jgi:hypothetical protein
MDDRGIVTGHGEARDQGPKRSKARRRAVIAGGATSSAAGAAKISPWQREGDATADERVRPLPGDELIADAASVTTKAVTVNAPPEEVWAWIVQIRDGYGFQVAQVHPGHALVLRHSPPEHPWDATWAFVLVDTGQGECRLIVRCRSRRQSGRTGTLVWVGGELFDPVTLIMTRKMLLVIRARAELATNQRRRRQSGRSPLPVPVGAGL